MSSDEPNVVDPAVMAERRARRAELAEEDLAERAESAERAVVSLEGRLQDVQRQLNQVAGERDGLSESLKAHERELKAARQREYAEQQLRQDAQEEAVSARSAVEGEIDELRERLAATEDRVSELMLELDRARRAVAEAEEIASTERARADRSRHADHDREELLREAELEIEARLAALHASEIDLDQERRGVEARRGGLLTQLEQLQGLASTLGRDLGAEREARADAERRVEAERERAQSEVTLLQHELDRRDALVGAVQSQIGELRTELDSIRDRSQGDGARRAGVVAELQESLGHLRTELTRLETERDAAVAELAGAREALTVREAELVERGNELDARGAELRRGSEELLARDADLTRLRGELERTSAELTASRAGAKIREDALEEAERQLNAARDAAADLQGKLELERKARITTEAELTVQLQSERLAFEEELHRAEVDLRAEIIAQRHGFEEQVRSIEAGVDGLRTRLAEAARTLEARVVAEQTSRERAELAVVQAREEGAAQVTLLQHELDSARAEIAAAQSAASAEIAAARDQAAAEVEAVRRDAEAARERMEAAVAEARAAAVAEAQAQGEAEREQLREIAATAREQALAAIAVAREESTKALAAAGEQLESLRAETEERIGLERDRAALAIEEERERAAAEIAAHERRAEAERAAARLAREELARRSDQEDRLAEALAGLRGELDTVRSESEGRAAREAQVGALVEELVSTAASLREGYERDLAEMEHQLRAEVAAEREEFERELAAMESRVGDLRAELGRTADELRAQLEHEQTARWVAEAELAAERERSEAQRAAVADARATGAALERQLAESRSGAGDSAALDALQAELDATRAELAELRSRSEPARMDPEALEALRSEFERLRSGATERRPDEAVVTDLADAARRLREAPEPEAEPAADAPALGRVVINPPRAAAPPVALPARPSFRAGPWMPAALGRLAEADPESAVRLIVTLLGAHGALAGSRSLAYDVDVTGTPVVARVMLHAGQASVDVRPVAEPGEVDLVVRGPVAALVPLAAGGAGRRLDGVEVTGRRRRLKPILKGRRAAVTLAELAAAGVPLEPGPLLAVLAQTVDPGWTAGSDFTVDLVADGAPPARVTVADGAPLAISEPDESPARATLRTTAAELAAVLGGTGGTATLEGDAPSALLLLGWLERGQTLAR